MQLSYEYSQEYKVLCVIVEGDPTSPTDATEIIAYATAIGAEYYGNCHADEPPELVINFLTLNRRLDQVTEPKCFTAEDIRKTIADELLHLSPAS